MSLTQIEYFVAVAENGSVCRAAEQLAISQPPLTRQIRALEDELGVPLFSRGPRGMALLPSGDRFMFHARRILSELSAARSAVHLDQAPLLAHEGAKHEPSHQRLVLGEAKLGINARATSAFTS